MRRVVEFPIEQSFEIVIPEIELLKTEGKPIGGHRKSPYESHYMVSCDKIESLEFEALLASFGPIPFRLFGCFAYEVFPFRIVRLFSGLSVYLEAAPCDSWMGDCYGKPN